MKVIHSCIPSEWESFQSIPACQAAASGSGKVTGRSTRQKTEADLPTTEQSITLTSPNLERLCLDFSCRRNPFRSLQVKTQIPHDIAVSIQPLSPSAPKRPRDRWKSFQPAAPHAKPFRVAGRSRSGAARIRTLFSSKGDVHLQSTSPCGTIDRISELPPLRFSICHRATRKVEGCSDFSQTASVALKS
jgi:hypothetical protein